MRTVPEGLNCQYEPNRVDSLVYRLGEFERTLGLISSRLGGTASDQLLDISSSTVPAAAAVLE